MTNQVIEIYYSEKGYTPFETLVNHGQSPYSQMEKSARWGPPRDIPAYHNYYSRTLTFHAGGHNGTQKYIKIFGHLSCFS